MRPDLFAGVIPEVLIADDTLDSLRLLSDALSEQGYDVRSVTSGQLALASARAAQPDLILLDIKMPDLSGYEVCQQLKADAQTREIPVIFLSALSEPFDKVRAFQVGGIDYITKPFHIEEVLVRIETKLALEFSLRQIHQLNAELEQRVADRTAALQTANQSLQQEVAERLQVEQELRASEEKFRQLSEHIQEVFWLSEMNPTTYHPTQVRYVSPMFEAIWGCPCEALYDDPWQWLAAIHPEDRQRVEIAFHANLAQGKYDEEYRVVHPDGTLRWIRDRGFPIPNCDGDLYRIAGIAEDITARKQAELERDRFFNLSPDLLFIADHRSQLKRFNPAWFSTLGYTEQQLLERSLLQLVHHDDYSLAARALRQLQQGQAVHELEMRCRCLDGSYVWIAWNAVSVIQENLIYGAGRNISQRKASEAQLIHETLHDALTGLANRPCFMERLALAIGKCRRGGTLPFCLLT
jgi:PAS domain S-box-containing protein